MRNAEDQLENALKASVTWPTHFLCFFCLTQVLKIDIDVEVQDKIENLKQDIETFLEIFHLSFRQDLIDNRDPP